uniref:Membrane protein, putative n=1 Tax=Theileria annulata TaxID=5874 RepID=A0A3B0MJJ6_THEAN
MKNIGVTFNFDESILLDDKIQIPLNFYKTNHNFTIQFKQQLYTNTDNKNKENEDIGNLDTRTGYLDKFGNLDNKFGNLDTNVVNLDNFGYLDIKELEELINENYISTKNLYNSFINNTINEHEKLQQHIKNQQLEQQLLEQQKLQNEQLEKEKLQNEQLEKEKLKQHQLLLEQQQQLEKDVIDFIPKNMTIKIFDEMKAKFKKLEEIYNEIKSNTELKSLRIELSKKIKICLNSIANTQKQVNLTFNNLSRILNESSENLKIFILFKIVEGVLNCCEQGQIYINPKSVWSFSRLLASIDHINNNFNIIFITLLTFKTILIIPKFYYIQSNRVDTMNQVDSVNQVDKVDMRLNRLYEYPEDINEEIIYNKRLSSYIRLYLSYLCIKNDFNTIWSYYANVINSSWNNIFIQFIPCLLITILNITSYFMYHIYKLQFIKVIITI